ncbi:MULTISPECIES: hypothetical protein [Saccharibacillus]|uniref:DUF4181 domain-containing protein n=1 Tax=Saccharibacillus brassicae TaxID=2583377 RepID=A0A4Y6UWU9_SACBS|nr:MULTISPECIES: hypothetical protein [Saccharibacillus]MWJ30925.1 hypothetical protein [Saccharibacillus sp. WB 17]QDH22189.1 hypothetical protein FFV09_15855 [Saccharibacillus brassicae]
MNPTTFPIILLGNTLLLLLLNFVVADLIVTGADRRRLTDVPRLKRYVYGITLLAIALLLGLLGLRLPPASFDLIAFALVLLTGLSIMALEKKYLPHTRRHVVTLCWIGGMCLLSGLYGWVTYA